MTIPPSYLFRSVYNQRWELPDEPAVPSRPNRFIHGLVRPVAKVMGALLGRPSRSKGHRHFGIHAYE